MKFLIAFLLLIAGSSFASISTATKPHIIDSAVTPHVSYVDDNDDAILSKLQEAIDTLNLHVNGGVIGSVISSTGDQDLIIDSDNNGTTNRWWVSHNGATDTLWRILESGAWKGFGDGYVSGKIVVTDSIIGATIQSTGNLISGGTLAVTGAQTGSKITLTDSLTAATVRATGNLSAGGTLAITGASSLAALSATTGSFSSTLAASGQSTLAGITLNGGSSGAGNIFTTASRGLELQAKTGSSYDFAVSAVSGSPTYLLVSPTGTNNIAIPNGFLLSYLSSGRIPVVSTSGLITQDNLYWDATNDRLGIGSGASSPATDFELSKGTAGTATVGRIYNTDNTNGSSNAILQIFSGGASGGDPFVRFNINGATDWSVGPDNSDADAFVITPAATPGGATNGLRISTAGAVTMPGTLGVTGKLTGSDTVVATLGLRSAGTSTLTGAVAAGSTMTVAGKFTGSDTVVAALGLRTGGGEAFQYGDTTFTLTAFGFTTSPTGTAIASRVGKIVTLQIPYISGTSNSNQFYLTGIPSGWRPGSSTFTIPISGATDNGIGSLGGFHVTVDNTGTITLSGSSAWTTSGTKATSRQSTETNVITYLVP